VRSLGRDLARAVAVSFGSRGAAVLAVHTEAGRDVVDMRTPASSPGPVAVTVDNLDESGRPIPGERVVLPGAYHYTRPELRGEADLTRVVRALLRALKDQVVDEVHLSVAVDYAEPTTEGVQVTALASLPSLVLSGPQLRWNPIQSEHVDTVEVVPGLAGNDVVLRRATQAFDLSFQLLGASDRAVELLNLMAAVARFLDRNRWLEVERDPGRPGLGVERFELERDGGTHMRVAGRDGVHNFTTGLAVCGVPLVEGPPVDRTRALTVVSL
jgi:hypothetical protein